MRRTRTRDWRCSFVVLLDGSMRTSDELVEFAHDLSALRAANCEVVIVDDAPPERFRSNEAILRWVGRHVPADAGDRAERGGVDLFRAATALASCEKVIVATDALRWRPEDIEEACALLERHEVVIPQDVPDPAPWWSGVDAARVLMQRAIDEEAVPAGTIAFRRSVLRCLRGAVGGESIASGGQHFSALGAEVHRPDLYVRRIPGTLPEWLAQRTDAADSDLASPGRSVFSFALIPVLAVIAFLGGFDLAGGYTGLIAAGSVALALRARTRAGERFPLRTCLLAPVSVAERSISVWCALYRRLCGDRVADARSAGVERAHRRAGTAR